MRAHPAAGEASHFVFICILGTRRGAHDIALFILLLFNYVNLPTNHLQKSSFVKLFGAKTFSFL